MVVVLCDFLQLNVCYDDEVEVVICYGVVYVGIVIQSDNGLMVLVLCYVELCDFWGNVSEVVCLVEVVCSGKV